MTVGKSDTRATNQVCNASSRAANGLRGSNINVSSAIAKKAPIALAGFDNIAVLVRSAVAINA